MAHSNSLNFWLLKSKGWSKDEETISDKNAKSKQKRVPKIQNLNRNKIIHFASPSLQKFEVHTMNFIVKNSLKEK